MTDEAVLNAMERFGGSFVRALAGAARRADEENLRRLKAAWPEFWSDYAAKAQAFAAREGA